MTNAQYEKLQQVRASKTPVASKNPVSFRVYRVNDCPDCAGVAHNCPTCGDEPDQPGKVIKVRGKWYERVTK